MLGRAAAHAQAGRGQVVGLVGEAGGASRACSGSSALACDARLAPARGRIGLLRQGDLVPATDRSHEPLFRHSGTRRGKAGAREDIGCCLPRKKLLRSDVVIPRRAGLGRQDQTLDRACAGRAPEGALQRTEAAADPRIAGAAALPGVRGSTGSTRNRTSSTGFRQLAGGPRAAAREFPPGIRHTLGEEELLFPGAHRSAAGARCPRAAGRAAGSGRRARRGKGRAFQSHRGNPLFLEESVQPGGERSADRNAGHLRPTGPLPAVFLPQSIEALLAARIDRLPPRGARFCSAPR